MPRRLAGSQAIRANCGYPLRYAEAILVDSFEKALYVIKEVVLEEMVLKTKQAVDEAHEVTESITLVTV